MLACLVQAKHIISKNRFALAAVPSGTCLPQARKTGLLHLQHADVSKSHGGGCGAYLEEVPDHAFDLGLLGRSVGDALLCAWPAAHPCTVPCFCKPTFQVPSLGKPAANVEANLSKQYALLELLCSHKEQCKHACICSWRSFGAIVNNVSMHTCSFGNLTSPKST